MKDSYITSVRDLYCASRRILNHINLQYVANPQNFTTVCLNFTSVYRSQIGQTTTPGHAHY